MNLAIPTDDETSMPVARSTQPPVLPQGGRAAASAIEEKAALLDLLFEATLDGIVDWDVRNNSATYNERWRFLLGYDNAELNPTPTTWRESFILKSARLWNRRCPIISTNRGRSGSPCA